MIIGGFQKFSLLEYPGKICAVLFTQGCNFRCPYCHNPNLVDPARYEETFNTESILNFLHLRKGKLEAVTITGGEPTIHNDLYEFIAQIKEMGYAIKLDTNGSIPDVTKRLITDSLVDYWAMDIKAPLPLYSIISGSSIDESCIVESMNLIRSSNKDWEFRTTYYNKVLNWNDILDIQPLLKQGDKYFLQQCSYENTLVPIEATNQSNVQMIFDKDNATNHKAPNHHYSILSDKSKLHQIILKMR